MGREEYGEEKELLMIQSVEPHLMLWVCTAAMELVETGCTDHVNGVKTAG